MQIMNPTPNTDNASSTLTADNAHLAAFRRTWQWLTRVQAEDPLRYALNRGFAYVIMIIVICGVLLTLTFIRTGETRIYLVYLASMPIHVLIWWLNRRGTVYGAVLFTLWCIVATTLGSMPSTYAGATTPIPLVFILPLVIATLFVFPVGRSAVWSDCCPPSRSEGRSGVLRERVAWSDISGAR